MNFSQRAVRSGESMAGPYRRRWPWAAFSPSSLGGRHEALVRSGQRSGSGLKCCPQHPCISLSILVEPLGLGLRFAPRKGAAGTAVSTSSCQSTRLLWSKFLCLHFKTNCDVCMPSATLNFISRMHVLANILLICRDGSQTLPFVEWLLRLLHGSCTGQTTFWVAKAHSAWKNSLQYYWGSNFLKNKMPECK